MPSRGWSVAVVGVLGLAGCGGGTTGPAAPSSVTIDIRDFSFGDKQYVKPGGKVTVRNAGPSVHSILGLESAAPSASGDIAADGTLQFTAPSKTGSYVFTCGHHDQMAGVLVVSDTAKPVPTSSFSIQPGP